VFKLGESYDKVVMMSLISYLTSVSVSFY